MLNCIKADLLRVLKKKSFIIFTCIELALIVGMAALSRFLGNIDAQQNLGLGGFLSVYKVCMAVAQGFAPYLVGAPVFSAIFSDDFKSRAMQAAIGHGLSRSRLVLCRFLEAVFVIAETFAVFCAAMAACGIVLKVSQKDIKAVILDLCVEGLTVICCYAVAMIIVYSLQNAAFAMSVYIILIADTVSLVLMGLSSMVPFFRDRHIDLTKGWITKLIESARGGRPELWAVLVGAYIVLPLALSMVIFRKKELEF